MIQTDIRLDHGLSHSDLNEQNSFHFTIDMPPGPGCQGCQGCQKIRTPKLKSTLVSWSANILPKLSKTVKKHQD